MNEGIPHTWSEFVLRRMPVVGIRSQLSLAKLVGCTRQQIRRWLSVPTPPKNLRKKFDFKLCAALKISQQNLFADWPKIKPEEAAIIDPAADAAKAAPKEQQMRADVASVAELLSGDKLQALHATAQSLLSAMNS